MSESDFPHEKLDRDTVTGDELANWLNKYGSEWALKIEPLGEDPEYVGVVDGRFTNSTERGLNHVALGYLADIAERARRIDYVPREDSPFAADENDEDDA
ncbi:hypothetical protein [Haloplanus halobius]|uniref:hypothetical protein n=1 Tax=Haloplanus halobius TaxID=2934938 RepID=UPI00200F05C8|nr:hypothetical protein [Haloplanus sp. XH21]